MKHQKHPAYWQLDLFMVVMAALTFSIMGAHLSAGWEIAAESAWSVLMLAGLSLWVWLNAQA